jgi:hypothetical protein
MGNDTEGKEMNRNETGRCSMNELVGGRCAGAATHRCTQTDKRRSGHRAVVHLCETHANELDDRYWLIEKIEEEARA